MLIKGKWSWHRNTHTNIHANTVNQHVLPWKKQELCLQETYCKSARIIKCATIVLVTYLLIMQNTFWIVALYILWKYGQFDGVYLDDLMRMKNSNVCGLNCHMIRHLFLLIYYNIIWKAAYSSPSEVKLGQK